MWGVITGAVLFCLGYTVFLFSVYYQREKKLIYRLSKMIKLAEEGKYKFDKVDESLLSFLENSMNRFLGDSLLHQKNLIEQKEKIQTLISDISHQSITPISNILLYTQLLEERDAEKKCMEEIPIIRTQTEKLSFLINSLVKLSRLENGIITVEPKQNRLQELIDVIVKQCKAKAEEKRIELIINPTDIEAFFDIKWSTEALYNILENAVKYTSVGGSIRITVEAYSFFCRIIIADNGIGIAENEIAKIFLRFYRSKEVTDEEGIGIGLYLARQIITMQNGYIKVDSTPHRGSAFSVFFPLTSQASCLKS